MPAPAAPLMPDAGRDRANTSVQRTTGLTIVRLDTPTTSTRASGEPWLD